MKINEIVEAGDAVLYSGEVHTVKGFDKTGELFLNGIDDSISVSLIEPIDVSTDSLKHIGIDMVRDENGISYYSPSGDGYVEFALCNDGIAVIVSRKRIAFKHVHKLQHFMRSCGFENQANFK